MNKMTKRMRFRFSHWRSLGFLCFLSVGVLACAEQRNVCLLPLASEEPGRPTSSPFYPDALYGVEDVGWSAYMRVWQEHQKDPSNLDVRRFLGLPTEEPFVFQAKRGRSSPRWLEWRPGTFAQVDTSHFTIFSTADELTSRRVAEDLEHCYWVWTQLFFPLWEGSAQVTTAFADWDPDQSLVEFLATRRPRLSIRRQLQVVLLKDKEQYRRTLAAEGNAIEQSTGFYSDSLRTIFLYGIDDDAVETRRHELTHQLFREATRSSLGQAMPGEQSDFWLVEGIAGYMESMKIGERQATIGGWDASRLQYARYRVLVGQDLMLPDELMRDGLQQAQRRDDLARWYSHSIANVHALMDGGDVTIRRWLYHRLSSLYRSRSPLAPLANQDSIESQLMQSWGRGLQQYLYLDDAKLEGSPPSTPVRVLCLSGCEITEDALGLVPASSGMTWLDLAGLPVGNAAVQRLVPDPSSLEQLTLEVTKVDDGMGAWLQKATGLRELDMSWTKVGDSFLQELSGFQDLSVLWMTGTRLTDQSIDAILRLPKLESLDVQRTQISEAGLERIRKARPSLQVNPLELRSP
jgi:hypothetical protein